MFPALLGIILTVPYFIEFIPKWNKWEPAIVSLLFFSLNAAISSMSGILVNVLDSNGRVRKTLELMVIWTALTWLFTLGLIQYFDYNGVAIASFLVTLTIVYTIHLVKQVVEFNFLKSIEKPIMATVAMGLVTYILTQLIVKDLITLVFVILIGGGIYLFTLYLVAGKEIISDIRKIVLKGNKPINE